MIVRVRLFARARDLAGSDVLRVELPDGAAVAELRRRLAAEHPALAPLLERSAIAVENELAGDSLILSSEAEIALLPPVSGGQFPTARLGCSSCQCLSEIAVKRGNS
jgi:molybdopterin converting factor subunit 1